MLRTSMIKYRKKRGPRPPTKLIFITILIVIVIPEMYESSVIKLFDKYHFYEVNVNRVNDLKESLGVDQLFNYNINSLNKCSNELSGDELLVRTNFDNQDKYQLNVDPLIYSNYEQTMSFMLGLNLKPKFETSIFIKCLFFSSVLRLFLKPKLNMYFITV
jgi:hypothetical protein